MDGYHGRYGYTYPPSKLFLGATTRNSMVWSAVKKAFFQARIGPTRKAARVPRGALARGRTVVRYWVL